MSGIPGTNVAAPLAPFDTNDTYPTHDEAFGAGGYRTVANEAARDAIPVQRRRDGMRVRVKDVGLFQLSKNDADPADLGVFNEVFPEKVVKPSTVEAGGGKGVGRWRIGNRVFGKLDPVLGFQFFKLRLMGSATTVDDLPNLSLKSRLLGSAISGSFKDLPANIYQGMRWRIGNRLFMTMDAANGVYPRKMTLPKGAKIDDGGALSLSDRLLKDVVGSFFKRSVVNNGLRLTIGNRIFVTLDAVKGLYPRKLTIPAGALLDDGTSGGIGGRLVGAGVGDTLKRINALNGVQDMSRWRIGNRIIATIDIAKGFYPRRLTIPATAKIDDDLTGTLVSRLLGVGIGVFFKRLPAESGGGVVRFRLGNRLLGSWSNTGGMAFTRMTLPKDVKLADQPSVLLTDRLGGSQLAFIDGPSYAATSVVTGGKKVICTFRKSDGRQFNNLTASTYNAYPLAVTADNKVVFWDDELSRQSWVSAEGGTKYRVFGDVLIIDAWGDSLTAGAGSTGSGAGQGAYPKQLRDRIIAAGLTVTINNRGVGGQNSTQIIARQGGAPALLTVENNQIPASGPVNITARSVNPANNQGGTSLTGTLAGVPGTLVSTYDGNGVLLTNTFTRTTAGAVVSCPANTPFIPDFGVQTQERVNLFKIGRNDGSTNGATTLARAASGIAYIKSIYRRFLILAVEVGSTEIGTANQTNINNTNAQLAALYGDDFVDVNLVPTVEEMATLNFVPDSYGIYANYRTDAADLNGRASGGWTFTANPASGDTVSVAGTTITFGTTVAIGADNVATAANLATYINANTGALGVTAISGTTAAGAVLCTIVAVENGTSGNSITIARSSSALTVSGSVLANGSATPGVPSGMMSGAVTTNNDWLHRNNFGYALNALRVYRKLYAKGWLPGLTLV